MIKILHTADWHLGQNFFGYDRAEEHEHFLIWLAGQVKELNVDALLIAGDVFDISNPSAFSQRMFYRFIHRVTVENPLLQIVIIAGNHDSAARLEAPLPLLQEMNTHIKGVIKRVEGEIDYDDLIVELKNKEGLTEAFCMAVPYLRQGDYPSVETDGNPYAEGVRALYSILYNKVKERQKPGQAVIAMGHLQATGSEISETDHSERTIIGGLECVSPEAFDNDIVYTALGHIHKAQKVSDRDSVRYAGSPLSMSFAEKNYHHGIMLVTLENGILLEMEKVNYTPLVSLISVPSIPQPPETVLAELKQLPETQENLLAPFLEIKVLLQEPEPSLKQEIENILSSKHVRLARITSTYLTGDENSSGGIELYEGLQDMNPLQIAQITFRNKYQTEMPDELIGMFQEVYMAVSQKQEDKR